MPKTDNNNKWGSYHWNPNLPLWRTYPYNIIKLEKYVSSVIVILHKIIFRLFSFEKENEFVYFTLAVYINILVKFILNLGQHQNI